MTKFSKSSLAFYLVFYLLLAQFTPPAEFSCLFFQKSRLSDSRELKEAENLGPSSPRLYDAFGFPSQMSGHLISGRVAGYSTIRKQPGLNGGGLVNMDTRHNVLSQLTLSAANQHVAISPYIYNVEGCRSPLLPDCFPHAQALSVSPSLGSSAFEYAADNIILLPQFLSQLSHSRFNSNAYITVRLARITSYTSTTRFIYLQYASTNKHWSLWQ